MKKIALLVLSCLIVLSISFASFAGDKKLSLDSSTIEDGATEVSLTPEINLVFTNNVINNSVREANMSAISMTDSKDNIIEISVVMADDQVNPEEKRNVKVAIKNELSPSSEYVLHIDGSFSGKNGSALGEEVKISFATIAGESNSPNYMMIFIGVTILALVAFIAFRKKTTNNV